MMAAVARFPRLWTLPLLLALGGGAHALTAVDDLVYVPASEESGGYVDIFVLDNDDLGEDPQQVGVIQRSELSPSNAGELYQEGPAFFFIPASGFSGIARFTYSLSSSEGESNTATVTIQVGLAANPGFTPQESHAAEVILNACANATGALAQACASIEQLEQSEQLGAIQQILPNQVSAQINGSRLQQARQTTNLRGRLQNLRSGARGLSFAGLSLQGADGTLPVGSLLDSGLRGQGAWYGDDTLSRHRYQGSGQGGTGLLALSEGRLALSEVMPLHQRFEEEIGGGGSDSGTAFADTPWGVFLTGRINRGDVGGRAGEPGFDFDTLALTAGIDYRYDSRLVLGGALGFSSTENDFGRGRGGMDADTWSLSFYGNYHPRDNAYIDWMAGYSWNDYRGQRRLLFGEVDSMARYSTDGHQYHLSVGGGFDWNHEAWQYGPYLRLNYLHTTIDGYRERGGAGLALHIGEQRQRMLETAIGGRVSRAISIRNGVLIPGLDVEWVRDWENGDRRISASLAEAPDSGRFSVTTRSLSPRYVNIGASLTGVFSRGRSVFIRYQTVSHSRDVDEYSIEAGLRLEF